MGACGQVGPLPCSRLLKRQAAEGELPSDLRLKQYRKGPAAFVRGSSRASPERTEPLRPDWRQRFISVCPPLQCAYFFCCGSLRLLIIR